MTHTPIPWRAWPDGAITWGGTDNNDFVIAQVEMESTSEEQGMADAHLIVLAVNAHDELLAAATDAESWLASSLSAFNQLTARDNVNRAREILAEAIARASPQAR